MIAKELLKNWLAEMQPVLGIAPESWEESNTVSLDCGDDLTVHIGAFNDDDWVHFFATLIKAPENRLDNQLIMKDALRLNLELLGLIPGGIGLSPDEQEYVLSAHYPALRMDPEIVSYKLENFITICKRAKVRLSEQV